MLKKVVNKFREKVGRLPEEGGSLGPGSPSPRHLRVPSPLIGRAPPSPNSRQAKTWKFLRKTSQNMLGASGAKVLPQDISVAGRLTLVPEGIPTTSNASPTIQTTAISDDPGQSMQDKIQGIEDKISNIERMMAGEVVQPSPSLPSLPEPATSWRYGCHHPQLCRGRCRWGCRWRGRWRGRRKQRSRCRGR